MHIKKILNQNRRDFIAIFECEQCGYEFRGHGYDDSYFHQSVVPKMECPKCGKAVGPDYRPLATKYPDGMTI